LTKKAWTTFWATFSQTDLVTLLKMNIFYKIPISRIGANYFSDMYVGIPQNILKRFHPIFIPFEIASHCKPTSVETNLEIQ
jgi:hypothetical protein